MYLRGASCIKDGLDKRDWVSVIMIFPPLVTPSGNFQSVHNCLPVVIVLDAVDPFSGGCFVGWH